MAIRILSSIRAFVDSCKFIWKYRCRLGSDRDFVLRVAPLRDKKHSSYRNYFPPPLYGIPPGRSSGVDGDYPENYGKYGLFLWPDKLYLDVSRYKWLLFLTLLPFVFLVASSCVTSDISISKSNCSFYILAIFLLSMFALSMKWFFILLFRYAEPVLSEIWSLWPESQYERFLTVPHFSELDRKDYQSKKTVRRKYWRPDIKSPLKYQPEYYGKGKKTLQEVMLHFSAFNYLFHRKKKKNYSNNSLKMRGWIFLFSPIWISYLLILAAFFVSSLFYPTKLPDYQGIFSIIKFPYFYVFLIIIWSALTLRLIMRQIRYLENLNREIKEGYYEDHLDLIPQQILNVVDNIPRSRQIHKGIERVESAVRLVQAGALVTFLMIIEIFTSAYN